MTQQQTSPQQEIDIDIKNPEWLLLVIVTLMLWIFGFVDLLNETSEFSQTVLGRYSVGYFAFIVVYGLTFFGLLTFLRQKSIERLKGWVAAIQQRPFLASSFLVFLIIAFVITSEYDRVTKYSVFQMCLLAMMLMAGLVLLFANWGSFGKQQRWRKLFIYPLAGLTAVELVFQGLALAHLLPSSVIHQNGFFVPHGRIYHSDAQTINAKTNRYGWYYPDFREDESLNKIAIIGNSYIQGLQVHPQENLGVTLNNLINNGDVTNGPNEVMAFGMPGFGPGNYRELIEYSDEYFAPDEFVVFLNLGNDFQNPTKSSQYYFFYYLDEENDVRLESSSYTAWHDSQHLTIRSHEPFYLWQTIKSHYLTASVVQGVLGGTPPVFAASPGDNPYTTSQLEGVVWRIPRPWTPTHNSDWDIVFETAVTEGYTFTSDGSNDLEQGIMMTERLLSIMQEYAAEKNARLRLVTIPVFPPAFYRQYSGDTWAATVGDYDLLYAERALVEFAQEQNIPLLAMGSYMESQNLRPDEIRTLYFEDAYNYFTPSGHDYFAQAVYDCFYSGQDGGDGCFNR
jgi:hypothetical protein